MGFRKWIQIALFIACSSSILAFSDTVWKNLRPSEDIDFFVLDDFEERIKWNLGNSLGIQSTLRFVDNSPVDKNLQNYENPDLEKTFRYETGVLEDSAKIHGRKFSKTQRSAQELTVFFSNPGYDYQVIETPAKDKHFISGRPVAISVWVYGKNKKHIVYALFSNQIHEKIPVRIGDLNFKGWKRLEASIPASVSHRNRLNRNVREFRFDGFKITSHPHENTGSFSFLHDLVCVMVDIRGDEYSGSKMKDNWK